MVQNPKSQNISNRKTKISKISNIFQSKTKNLKKILIQNLKSPKSQKISNPKTKITKILKITNLSAKIIKILKIIKSKMLIYY